MIMYSVLNLLKESSTHIAMAAYHRMIEVDLKFLTSVSKRDSLEVIMNNIAYGSWLGDRNLVQSGIMCMVKF